MIKNIFKIIIIFILQIEAKLVILKYKPKIVAITGSVGKTSTKDAVYAAISQFSYVRKSDKSYNSEIGLPLTILGIPNGWNNPIVWLKNILKGLWLILMPQKYPKWLVLEVGVGKPGDMRKTASWLTTDVVIITAIGETPAHIEFFNSRKHLIEEKSQLINTLKKDGLLILNADDEDVLAMKNNNKHRTITYGFTDGSDVHCFGDSISYDDNGLPTQAGIPKGIVFRVDEGGNSFPVVIQGVFGRNHVYASLGALALISGLKLNILNAIDSLVDYNVSPGRMKLFRGINETLIIDDTYNSSPFACIASLRTLQEVKGNGRKIVVLGDMLELGHHTQEAHRKIGKIVKEILQEKDILVVVGMRAKDIKEGALEEGFKEENIFEFLDSYQAGSFIKNFLEVGDIVLVKGSQGIRMERIVEEIMLEKENKESLLVRQEPEWLEKK